jgi:hypothetical protein
MFSLLCVVPELSVRPWELLEKYQSAVFVFPGNIAMFMLKRKGLCFVLLFLQTWRYFKGIWSKIHYPVGNKILIYSRCILEACASSFVWNLFSLVQPLSTLNNSVCILPVFLPSVVLLHVGVCTAFSCKGWTWFSLFAIQTEIRCRLQL